VVDGLATGCRQLPQERVGCEAQVMGAFPNTGNTNVPPINMVSAALSPSRGLLNTTGLYVINAESYPQMSLTRTGFDTNPDASQTSESTWIVSVYLNLKIAMSV
jgi:hypothetical protein